MEQTYQQKLQELNDYLADTALLELSEAVLEVCNTITNKQRATSDPACGDKMGNMGQHALLAGMRDDKWVSFQTERLTFSTIGQVQKSGWYRLLLNYNEF